MENLIEENLDININSSLFSPLSMEEKKSEDVIRPSVGYWANAWRRLNENKVALFSLVMIVIIILFAIFGPILIEKLYGFTYKSTDKTASNLWPNAQHWFGTDNLGRDYWSQVWYATQTSIKLACIVAIGECVLGVTIGLLWGYVRQLDRFFTELYNVIDNIPQIIYMTLIALMVGKSFTIMAVSLIAFGWLGMARNIRNLVMMYRDREYNLASRCLGTPTYRILLKNILPYLISVIILRVALSIPRTISMETTLSYLGLGLDINTPTLGILLRNARSYFLNYPYLLVFPAVIVSVVTITFYLVGNAFSDAADPRNHV